VALIPVSSLGPVGLALLVVILAAIPLLLQRRKSPR
jgi:hypothetical protein